MKETALLEKFYSSFSKNDAAGMNSCYHEDIIFRDPAFGELQGAKVKAMWQMLLSRKESELKITYYIIEVNDKNGKVHWRASYKFGPKKRKVINNVSATFEFKDGKIYRHTDSFNTYKWAIQALGVNGFFLGWTGFFRRKIQENANHKLTNFMKNR